MNAELYVDVSADQLALALTEDKRLVELRKEKSNVQFAVGDVYLGRVKKIMPGLNAAFVDVGYEKDAFLHYLDLGPQFRTLNKFLNIASSKKGVVAMHKLKSEADIDKKGVISDVLTAGQNVLVQVAKEPISTKGPRLTSELSLAGRNLVLLPFSDKVSVSQKISSSAERNRLKRLLQSIKPKGFGVIIRTQAEDKYVAELDKELQLLIKRWEENTARIQDVTAPGLVIGEIGRTSALIRDIMNTSFNAIYVNSEDFYEEIKEYVALIAPDREKIVKHYRGAAPIFDQFHVNRQIKASFGKTVSFKSGAYLIIEHTEALHVIDVNSGNRSKSAANQETTALEVNLAAADEVARQLRLRDMGGIIVVDFIDMQNNENRQKVFEKMKQAMASDRTKHNILPLSKFGLMQITRQRVRPELHIVTQETCPSCLGTGKVTPALFWTEKIEAAVEKAVHSLEMKKMILKVHPFVYSHLKKGFPSDVLKWKFKYSMGLKVIPSDLLGFLEFKIVDNEDNEVDLD